MATVTGNESLAVADWDHGSESKSDRYLAARLAAAGADYKGVAVVTFVLAASVAMLAWLVLGVLAEHWVVPGGLPTAARWIWFCLGLVALAAAIVRWMVPLVRCRVNLVYAARVIEQEHPELHNDLVNAVLVKAHPEDAPPTVTRMLERRAARRLSAVPADGIADRGFALRLTVGLAALVAACCIYQLAAPKSLVVSAGRLLAPWWEHAPPARVAIAEPRLAWRMPPDESGGDRPAHPLQVTAGSVSLVRGRQLLVETDVSGLRADERPMLEVTPIRDDGVVDAAGAWRLPLTAAGRSERMAVVLPDAVRGLQHGVEFTVTAGDARTDSIRVAVVDTPTLLVREVRYEYPSYTGRPTETVAWQGDLRAPEFTKVVIVAESNRPLAAAWIDPGCTGRESERKRMRIGQHDLSRAIAEFPLRMAADRKGAEFVSYRLGFQPRSAAGAPETEIIEKLEHRVEVIPDVPPEATIEAPEDAIRVPPSAPVAIRVRAVDPDYGLARVFVEARVDQVPVRPEARLLEKPHLGVFTGAVELVPEKLGATAGRKLEYRVVAEDTRPERPNRTESPWRTLQIDAAARPQPPVRQPSANDGQAGSGEPRSGQTPEDKAAADDRRDARQRSSEDEGRREDEQRRRQQTESSDEQSGRQGGEQGGQQGGQQGGEQGRQPGGQPGGEGSGDAPAGGSSDRGSAGTADAGREGAPRSESSERDSDGGASGQKQPGGERDGSSQASGRPDGRGGRGDARPPHAVAADGTNDGEAMERILENRRRQESERGGDTAAKPARERTEQQDKVDGGVASQQPKSCQGADGKPCGKEGCASCGGGGAQSGASSGASGQASSSESAGAGGQAGDGQSGAGRASAGNSGDGKPGADQLGKNEGEAGQSGMNRSGEGASGQGEAGAAQGAKGKPGAGAPGSSASSGEGSPDGMAAQGRPGEGGSGAKQSDRGQAGARGSQADGSQAGADRSTGVARGNEQADAGGPDANPAGQGRATEDQARKGAGEGGEPGAKDVATSEAGGGQPGAAQPGAGTPGQGQTEDVSENSGVAAGSEVGGGGRVGGDRAQSPTPPSGATPPSRDVEWAQQETAHARNAADLAIEHLRDSVNQGRTDVLDELGWTPQQARAFIERWEAMRRLAESADPVARGEFERAVRSLGLRPDGVRTTRDVPADRKGGQAEGRRSRPPAAYREQVEAYLRGTGGG